MAGWNYQAVENKICYCPECDGAHQHREWFYSWYTVEQLPGEIKSQEARVSQIEAEIVSLSENAPRWDRANPCTIGEAFAMSEAELESARRHLSNLREGLASYPG